MFVQNKYVKPKTDIKEFIDFWAFVAYPPILLANYAVARIVTAFRTYHTLFLAKATNNNLILGFHLT